LGPIELRLLAVYRHSQKFSMISPNSFSGAPESSRSTVIRANHIDTTNPATVHDAELVRRFNSGDEDAFVEIVERHRWKIFSVAFSHLRNRADAEEIAQDTFIRAYRGLARFRGDSSLASWLHRIVFNLSCNRYGYFFRRHQHHTRSFDSALGDDSHTTLGDVFASDMPNPAREETNREFLANVAAGMAKLNDAQRRILSLRIIQDHSYEKIAEILNISPGTVKSRIARARENLRGLLADAYGEAESESDNVSSFRWFDIDRPAPACG
jgi:RNA polymerase sigma-70 factor (ECF subfamily)